MSEKRNDRVSIHTEQQNTKSGRQFGRRWLPGILFALLLSICITAGPAYADVAQGSGTVQTEAAAEAVESAENDKSQETEKEDPAVKDSAVQESDEAKVIAGRSPLMLPLLIIVVVLIILALVRLLLRPAPAEKLERLLEEYSGVYDTQHRYYAYCVEELNRLERVGAKESLSRLGYIRQDAGTIYNERIENGKRVDKIREGKMNDRTAVKSLKRILSQEQEHLRRLEKHLRVLREENAKYPADPSSGGRV